MPGLPEAGSTWPLADWSAAFAQYAENDAWLSDDQSKLRAIYSGTNGQQGNTRGDSDAVHYHKGGAFRGGVRGILSRMFNGTPLPQDGEAQTRIHAPVASNLATLSADILTSEPLTARLLDAEGRAVKGDASKRLDAIMNSTDTRRGLAEGAELTAGLGATVLTAHWDREKSDTPWMQVTPCDAAIPEFRAGRLTAVNLYTTYAVPEKVTDNILVHIERHEVGVVTHALYKTQSATSSMFGFGAIGSTVPLDTLEALEHIPSVPGSRRGLIEHTVELPTGIDVLTASWWRNLPTKRFRNLGGLSMLGRADFEGVEPLLDAVDEVWSSWMRDIKIARARLIVPESFLDVQGPGLGGKFNTDREVLTALNYVTVGDGKNETIQAHQFEIRAEEHAATLLALTKEITQYAGYSLASYGERSEASGVTATEITDRATMTERTRDKKFLYMAAAVDPITRALVELDRVHYRGPGMPDTATLDLTIPEISQVDPEKEARVFQYLRAAMAVSVDTMVRERNPDWDETEVKREVTRIHNEYGISDVAAEDEDAGKAGRVDPITGDPIDPEDEVDENAGDDQPPANDDEETEA